MSAVILNFKPRTEPVPPLFTAAANFMLSLYGWRSFTRMVGMGQAELVYKHPLFGEVVCR
jgi:hypothetical protein